MIRRSMLRIPALCLVLTILCTLLSPAASAAMKADAAQPKAEQLQALGLFRGTENGALELDRTLTRTEALVMLVRLLGKEEEALAFEGECPFTDVDGWAIPYVAWAYDQGLTKGISATAFGTGDATLNMYLTFVLRALGFEEGTEGDFTWDAPLEVAEWWLDPIPYDAVCEPFLRSDAAVISHAALSARVKLTRQTLADTLIDAGVFTREDFDAAYDASPYAAPTYEEELAALSKGEMGEGASMTLLAELPGQGAVYEVIPYGVPHTVNDFCLVFNADSYAGEGRLLNLEVPFISEWLYGTPRDFQLSEDGLTLTYWSQGYERWEVNQGVPGGPTLKDYFYTLDLTTCRTTVTSQVSDGWINPEG